MSAVTIDSIKAELDEIARSVESLLGLKSDNQTIAQANTILGRLFATVHRLNYLFQSSMGLVQSSAAASDRVTASIPSAGSSILNEFDSLVQQIKDSLSKVAKLLKGTQYSIGVQFPFSISVSITFTP